MKIPFDIKYRPQIESGEYKVVTANDHPVRILCYDRKGEFNIIALVDNGDIEIKQEYTPDGCFLHDKSKHFLDLFVITPEPELTDFEKVVLRCIEDYDPEVMSADEMCEEARKEAQKLLAIARKDLQPKYDATKVDEALIDAMVMCWRKRKLDNDVSFDCHEVEAYRQGLTDMYRQFAEELDEAFKHQDNVVYNQGYDKGTRDALKDIPSWQTGTPPYKSVWLTRTTHKDGHSTVACETFQNDKWPHEGDLNVLYLDMNKLILLPIDYGKDNY